jgi:hypothetical protein
LYKKPFFIPLVKRLSHLLSLNHPIKNPRHQSFHQHRQLLFHPTDVNVFLPLLDGLECFLGKYFCLHSQGVAAVFEYLFGNSDGILGNVGSDESR